MNGQRWPKEFWEWARENGLHPREPRGSPMNKLRQNQIARLHSIWVTKERREHETTPSKSRQD